MKLRAKNIIIISPEPWSHIFVSKHHYALELSKENSVFFINPPSGNYSITKTKYDNLSTIDYPGFIKGFKFLPYLLRKEILLSVFNKITALCQCDIDIIWSFDNSVFYDLNALPEKLLKISHIVDQNQNFQFRRSAKNADICFGVIPAIVEKFLKYNSNSFLINHGVFISEPITDEKIELPGKSKIKCIYIGNLSMPFIDRELLERLIEANQEIDFIFLGSNSSEGKNVQLQAMKNSFFLPKVAHDEIQLYLNAADICLIVYNSEYKSEYASPHKFLEYLYSGKVILSSIKMEEYGALEKAIYISASDPKDFLEKFNNLKNNLQNEYNSEVLMKKRKEIAIQNSYSKKLIQIEHLLTEAVKK